MKRMREDGGPFPRQLSKKCNRGFTLIELMMVSAIIGLLVGIALPKFGKLIIKAKEASVKGKLGSLRSALAIYYSDTEGLLPGNINVLMPTYISKIPTISIPPGIHEDCDFAYSVLDAAASLRDWGVGPMPDPPPCVAWVYGNVSGVLKISCTHADSKNIPWSSY